MPTDSQSPGLVHQDKGSLHMHVDFVAEYIFRELRSRR